MALKIKEGLSTKTRKSRSYVRETGVHRFSNNLVSGKEIEEHEQNKKNDPFYPKLPKWLINKDENNKYPRVGIIHATVTYNAFLKRLNNYLNAKKNSTQRD